ncbi:MAG: hypothetical protein R3B72_02910 [Polyangiaceae bacterium]
MWRCVLLGLTLTAACGGKAVIDGETGTGGASSSTTSSSSSASGAGGAAPPPVDVCGRCGEAVPEVVGSAPAALDELSGLAASRVVPGRIWAHNDSGDAPRLYLLDDSPAVPVEAKAVDWEDIAAGPCPDGDCLYVGDIGDNDEIRDDYVVYRVVEPSAAVMGPLAATPLPFAYPDGSHNAEALFFAEGTLWIITKSLTGVSQVFRFPALEPNQTLEEVVGAFQPPEGSLAVTGADANDLGVLVRTYSGLFFYDTQGTSVAAALAGSPCRLVAALEPQGEAVAWLRPDLGFVTASEGQAVPIHRSSCP